MVVKAAIRPSDRWDTNAPLRKGTRGHADRERAPELLADAGTAPSARRAPGATRPAKEPRLRSAEAKSQREEDGS